MGSPNDVWLCTFRIERRNRTEIDTSLVFGRKNNRFQIRVSQDYETQAKIEFSYSDADAYFATHRDNWEKARKAIDEHMATKPDYEEGMRSSLARLKCLK